MTGVPLKQVRRIIDAGLPDAAASGGRRSRSVQRDALLGVKLAYETTDLLTLDGRQRLVRYLLDLPEARRARERDLTVDVRTMKAELRKGLSVLPTPMVSARASLHGHHTARLRGEEVEQLAPAQLPAERNQPVCLRPMQPKAALREVDPDDGNLPHGCLLPQVVRRRHHLGTIRCRREGASTPSLNGTWDLSRRDGPANAPSIGS